MVFHLRSRLPGVAVLGPAVLLAVLLAPLARADPAPPAAAPQRPHVAVVFQPSAAELPQPQIRAAIAAELGTTLVGDPLTADGVVNIAVGRDGSLLVAYRPTPRTVVRGVHPPDDVTQIPVVLSLLAGNLVRNEAADLLAPGARGAPCAEAPRPPAPAHSQVAPARQRRWFAMLGAGTGWGWSRGTPEVSPTFYRADGLKEMVDGTGTGRAGAFHLVPEVAYLVRPHLQVGVQVRVQTDTGASDIRDPSCPDGTCQPAGALAVLGEIGWAPSWGPWRLRLSSAIGGGEIRRLVRLEDRTNCGPANNEVCVDTVVGGPFFFGPGATLLFDLNQEVSAYASLQMLAGVPNLMMNVDGVMGLALRL